MLKLILMTILWASQANAENAYKLFYIMDGKTVAAEDAIVASVKGHEVYKCQSVDAKVSKAGTSISLKNVKKPKAEK